jgi:rod shape-determining protein MreC
LAAPQDRPKFGPFLALGLFLLAFIGLPSGWKAITRSAFHEFEAPFWEITSRISDLSDYWGHQSDSKKTLISKNRDLSRIRSDWELQESFKEKWESEIAKLNGLHSQVEALREKIGLDKEISFSPILSRVTRRNLNSWWQELSLRKGFNQGIENGSGVIFSRGVIGRIYQTGLNSSKVQLATNPNFRIVAHFQGDDRPVTFQGNGILVGGQPLGNVWDVPHDIQIDKGKSLLLETSSLGGTFPGGLPIGLVTSLEESGDGLFKNGSVLLPLDIGKVSEVTILGSKKVWESEP